MERDTFLDSDLENLQLSISLPTVSAAVQNGRMDREAIWHWSKRSHCHCHCQLRRHGRPSQQLLSFLQSDEDDFHVNFSHDVNLSVDQHDELTLSIQNPRLHNVLLVDGNYNGKISSTMPDLWRRKSVHIPGYDRTRTSQSTFNGHCQR